MRTTKLALLSISLIISVVSMGQHVIRTEKGENLYVEIKELLETEVKYSYYQDSEIKSIPRKSVNYIKNLMTDINLWEANFRLKRPYTLNSFRTNDEIIFKNKYIISGLGYSRLAVKCIRLEGNVLTFIVSKNSQYYVDSVSINDVESIIYSQETKYYLFKKSSNVRVLDRVIRKNGQSFDAEITRFGMDGIKYIEDSKAVSRIDSTLTIPYSELDTVYLRNGQVLVLNFYANNKKEIIQRLVVPEYYVAFGVGFGTQATRVYTDGQDGFIYSSRDSSVYLSENYKTRSFRKVAEISFGIKVIKQFELELNYTHWQIKPTSFNVEYVNPDLSVFASSTYRRRSHLLGLGMKLNLGALQLGLEPTAALSNSRFDTETVYTSSQGQGTSSLKARLSSKPSFGVNVDMGVLLDFKTFRIVSSVAYSQFRVDETNMGKRSISINEGTIDRQVIESHLDSNLDIFNGYINDNLVRIRQATLTFQYVLN